MKITRYLSLLLVFTLFVSNLIGQECFYMKNEVDTLFRVNPTTGTLTAAGITPDFAGQGVFGYLHSIDGLGRRYMFITRISDTSFDDFGLKIIHLDTLGVTNIPLSGYPNTGVGQFSFHGMEYGAMADKVYLAPVSADAGGDSLYQIDITTGLVAPVQQIPGFANTYSYLQTFWQSEQRYSMIATDTAGQERLFQIDLDDDTTYVSPPLTFQEPLRGLEVSETTGLFYVVSDFDQTLYSIDPATGVMTAEMLIPNYQSAFGYLHTFDFSTDRYMFVGIDTDPAPNDSLSLFSIQPASGAMLRVDFPYPAAGFFGFEATNTQFITRLRDSLTSNPTTSIESALPTLEVQLFPNPLTENSIIRLKEPEPTRLEVLGMNGQVLMQATYPPQTAIKLGALRTLPAGVYWIRIQGSVSGKTWGSAIRIE